MEFWGAIFKGVLLSRVRYCSASMVVVYVSHTALDPVYGIPDYTSKGVWLVQYTITYCIQCTMSLLTINGSNLCQVFLKGYRPLLLRHNYDSLERRKVAVEPYIISGLLVYSASAVWRVGVTHTPQSIAIPHPPSPLH